MPKHVLTVAPQPPRPLAGAKAATPSAADVMSHLKRSLRRGALAPGQRLAEPDVMRETGASRGRVREALQRLASEGLVELHEFRGAVVKRLSRADVQHAYDMREMLEGLAARLAAEARLDGQDRNTLQALQGELDEAADITAMDRFARANDRYHEFIIQHAANAYLRSFLERLRIPIFRLQFHVFYTAESMRSSNTDHQRITRFILEGNGAKAERAMRAHVRNGLAAVNQLDDSLFA